MVVAVQTTYRENMDRSRPGIIQGSDYATETFIAEGRLGFGLAASQGATDRGAAIGGTLTTFRGITVRDIALVHADADLDVYIDGENGSLLTRGFIDVAPSAAVAANDPVYFNGTTGALLNSSAGGALGPVKGARWHTSAAGTGDTATVYLAGFQRGG